jgi:hypothetical protein
MNFKIKIRKSWGELNPNTRIRESKKAYDRKKERKQLEREYLIEQGRMEFYN